MGVSCFNGGEELFFRWGGTSFLSEGGAPWGGGFEKNHKMGGSLPHYGKP